MSAIFEAVHPAIAISAVVLMSVCVIGAVIRMTNDEPVIDPDDQ